jgi:hypothetical protein
MSKQADNIKTWKAIGLIAATVIVLSLPVYYFTVERDKGEIVISDTKPTFVGTEKCKDCHKAEYDKWQDSHHYHAMEAAGDESVLGDFNDTEFTIHERTTRFYRKEGGFFVYTHGPDGEMAEFEISNTFGWYPLHRWRTFHLMTGYTGQTTVRTGTACVPSAIQPT